MNNISKEYTRLRWRIYLGRPMAPPCLRTDWEEDRGHRDTLTDSTRETDWLAIVPPCSLESVCACGLLASREMTFPISQTTLIITRPLIAQHTGRPEDPRFLTCLERDTYWYSHDPWDGTLTYGSPTCVEVV